MTGYNPAFPSGSTTASYTVGATDSLNSIAAGLAAAINANSSMTGIGLSATNSAPTTLNWSQKFSANPAVLYSTQTTMSGTDGGGNTASSPPYTIYSNSNYAVLTYDYNGNMTSDGTNSFSWDCENRLVQITYPGTGNYSSFAYDGQGRRVQQLEYSGGSLTSTLNFVWCGTRICEARNSSGTIVAQYFALGEIDSSTNYFYEKTIDGSVIGATNSSGTQVASISYDPWGRPTILSGSFSPTFGYAGMYQHLRSGLNLTLFRAYSSTLGRWISRDPIEEQGGLNLYAYVGENPVSFVDPMGLGYSPAAGDFVDVPTSQGTWKIPAGEPPFGLPTNFKDYNTNVNQYVKWIETFNGKSIHWTTMSCNQKKYFANSLRHALGIGYLVFQGVDPDFAVQQALGHEAGDQSVDSMQDRNNNQWAAQTATQMAAQGQSWADFAAAASQAAANTSTTGFLK